MRTSPLHTVLPAAILGIALATSASAQEGSSSSRQAFSYQSTDDDGRSIELRIENGRVVTAKVDGTAIPSDRVKKVADGYDFLDADGKLIKHISVQHKAVTGGYASGGSASGGSARGGKQGEWTERPAGMRGGSSAQSQSGSSSSSSNGRTRSESTASGSSRGNGRASADTNGVASRAEEQRLSEVRSRARLAVGPDGEEVEIREGFPIAIPPGMEEAIEVNGFDVGVDGGIAADPPKSMIGAGLGTPDAAIAHQLRIDPLRVTLVTSIVEGLPAQLAGIEQYDLIVAVNGDGNASTERLRSVLRDAEPGSKIKLEVRRGGEVRKVEVTVAAFDAEKIATFAFEIEGMPLSPLYPLDISSESGGNVMFFVGPDGERRELRLPAMPQIPVMPNGLDPAQMEGFERAMENFERRMEEWGRKMEILDRAEAQRDGAGENEARQNASPRSNREGDSGDRNNNNDADRMRRLEAQMEQLMRELERERDERARERDERERAKPRSEA